MTATPISAHRDTADQNARCYLLDLPGELRNRIYHFAVESEPITYMSSRLEMCNDERIDVHDIKKTRPDYLAITQVCRQLRQEYSPIYAAEAEICVCHEDLREFITKRAPFISRDEDLKEIGNLYVDCKAAQRDLDRYEVVTVDLLPFLRYCTIRPGLLVLSSDCGCNFDTCMILEESLDILFAVSRTPKLQAWLENAVDAIWLDKTPSLRFDLKMGQRQEWMNQWGILSSQDSEDPELLEWMENTGFTFAADEVLRFEGGSKH